MGEVSELLLHIARLPLRLFERCLRHFFVDDLQFQFAVGRVRPSMRCNTSSACLSVVSPKGQPGTIFYPPPVNRKGLPGDQPKKVRPARLRVKRRKLASADL